MITKQKKLVMLAFFILVATLANTALAAVQNDRALAYTIDEDCGKYSSIGEEEACRKFQAENGGNPEEEEEPDCTPGEEGCCGGVKTSIIGGDICGSGEEDGSENGPIFNLLINTLRILTAGIGIAAVGGIAYGALLYTTAENKPEQTKKAISIITNVVIGIVAYGLMFVLLNFLIPGGVITR